MQVNGRVRDRMEVSVERVRGASWSSGRRPPARVQAHLDGKEIRQTIVVPGKLVNLVV